MQPIKTLVFDMAGTTVNEGNLVYKTLHHVLLAAGEELSLDTVMALGAGKEKLQAVKDILQHLAEGKIADEEKALSIYQRFMAELAQAYQNQEVAPFPGIEQLLRKLRGRGLKVVLNTGYDRKTANELLAKMGWHQGCEYDLLVTASEVEHSRPAPDMIHFAMQLLGIDDPREIAKIGDSTVDIEEGKSAGCGLTIGVTTGAHTRTQLEAANPNYILDSLTELELIEELTPSNP